jgi:petrobactin synthase
MIRVHCFVSCVCESLNRVEGVDERPFYFGVWDAPFFVGEDYVLAYHSPGSDQAFFCQWFERLYGARIHDWYDRSRSKEQNVERLLELLEHRPAERNVMVMLDMFRLPERENKFNQNPFPHYVMLRTTADPERWLMQDPDFRWEGVLDRQRILDAIASPDVAGGYYFDDDQVRPADDRVVREYFEACLNAEENPFTAAIQRIVQAHLDGRAISGLPGLTRALREIPALAIRKYAYEHGFAFFWRALGLDHDEFLAWCDLGESLVKTYTTVQYRAMKLAMTGDRSLAGSVFELLERQHETEIRMKRRLVEVYRQWGSQRQAPSKRAHLLEEGAAR